MSLRNIAIIAHVDHGKTTLVDALLTQSGTMKKMEDANLIMDSNDQEKERGITIYAKNTSVQYGDHRINIIDTPGHADFGSEVERVLRMVDCVLLVVDAYEGPMPQTKFVLKKSLELGLKPIVVINKIDKSTARPDRVLDELFNLFITLGATDEQCEFPVVYASAKNGYAMNDYKVPGTDIIPVFEAILKHVPEAPDNSAKPLRMQITNLGYDNFVGRLGIARILDGVVKANQAVTVFSNEGKPRSAKISKVYTTLGLQKIEVQEALSGDIVTISGITDIYVGETVAADASIEPFPAIKVDEPTLRMEFTVNDSPFAGKEGKYVTSRNIFERLEKELETNVGLQVEFLEGGKKFEVSGRGELHLSVLIETMRREGFELQIGAPRVIMKKEDGHNMEPIENMVITVEDALSGTIIGMVADRKGMMQKMESHNGMTSVEFMIPTRGLLGLRAKFVVLTKGEGIMYSSFSHYEQYKGEIPKRDVGSLISQETGKAMKYSIRKLQERGKIFVDPAADIYEGMIVGESAKPGDLVVNLTKNKQQTNVRNSGNDEAMRLEPIFHLTLEDALGYIGQDEYVEVTPSNIRLRKVHLTEHGRSMSKKGVK